MTDNLRQEHMKVIEHKLQELCLSLKETSHALSLAASIAILEVLVAIIAISEQPVSIASTLSFDFSSTSTIPSNIASNIPKAAEIVIKTTTSKELWLLTLLINVEEVDHPTN